MSPAILKALPSGWTLGSALLIVLAFPHWDLSPLVWISLVFWLEKAVRPDLPQRVKLKESFWLGFLMSLGGFYWVAYSLKQFGNLPWAIAVPGLLLLCTLNQPQFLTYAWLSHRLFSRNPRLAELRSHSPLLFSALTASLYTAIDGALPKLFQDTLGHAFYRSPWIRQWADVGGAPLLTWVAVWVNQLLASLLFAPQKPSRERATQLRVRIGIALAASTLALCTYGVLRQKAVLSEVEASTRKARFGVIQANIGDFDKVASESGVLGAATRVLNKFYQLSESALSFTPKPQVLVWPETSYPSTFRVPSSQDDRERDLLLEDWVNRMGVPLLFGGYDRENRKDFNAFFFLQPKALSPKVFGKSQDLQVYHKSLLLLFGETIPGAEHFEWIRNQFPQVGNFGRGPGPTVLEVRPDRWPENSPPLRIQPIICYEALFPWFTLAGATYRPRGSAGSSSRNEPYDGSGTESEMILNITNDSWFGPYGEPHLHLALTTFRGIETRLPQLRSTNTGISTLIRADGEILEPTALNQEAILSIEVPLTRPIPTLLGVLARVSPLFDNWFWRLCLTLVVSLAAAPWLHLRLIRQRRT